MEFGDKVLKELRKRINSDMEEGPACRKCSRVFKTQSALNCHDRDCKRADNNWARLAVNGSYICLICAKVCKSKDDLKNHLFYRHSEVDVMVKYGIPFEKVVGEKAHNRLRSPFLRLLGRGKFNQFIDEMLSDIIPFEVDELPKFLPIEDDRD